MSRLHLQFFGDFQVLHDGVTETRLNSPRTQAVLALLVIHHRAPQSRAHVAFQLWPDLEEAQARGNLRYQLHVLRRALPTVQDVLISDEQTLHWRADAPGSSDVQEFEFALEQAEAAKRAGDHAAVRRGYERAVDLYRGELLPSCYDDWILPERERYRQLYVQALEELIELAAAEQDYRAAISLAQRLLRHDPLHEDTYRRLMHYHAAMGDRVGAVRIYHTCVALLDRELGVEPSAAIHAAYESVRRETTEPPRRSVSLTKAAVQIPGALPNQLPIYLTSFVGRERELVALKKLFAKTRLLTLNGAGGSGKTRLALEAATGLALEHSFPDGVWWVDLGELMDAALVPQTILLALGLREQAGIQFGQVLLEHLHSKELLLVLDNCEHLLSACQEWTQEILHACPNVYILATSRAPLGVDGEVNYPVAPLSVPPPRALGETSADFANSLSQFEAVRLFVERAVAGLPTFTLNQKNARAVLDLCRQLEGIPLAIELAAARVRVLSPAQIAARLGADLGFLTSGKRAKVPRHRTLRATLDWSYELLSESERILLRRLAVFAGGFTLEAAEAIVGDDASNAAHEIVLRRAEVLDLLSMLVDKSLVDTHPEHIQDDTVRYRLLELIRQYADEKLIELGEAGELHRVHGRFFLALAEEGFDNLRGPKQTQALHRLEREHDNFRAALDWSRQGTDIELGLRLGGALSRFWWIRGYAREGRDQLRQLLEKGDRADDAARAQALYGAYLLEWRLANYACANVYAEEYLALERKMGKPASIAHALSMLANVQGDDRREWAKELLNEGLALARESGDKSVAATTLNNLGEIARQEGDYASAADYYGQMVALNQELKIPETLSLALHNLG